MSMYYIHTYKCNCVKKLTSTRQESARQKVPERPIPALQCTTGGPTFELSAPDSRTVKRKSKNAEGDAGTPKSGHVV